MAACAMTFVVLQLLSTGGAQLPNFQSLNRFNNFGKHEDPGLPLNTENTVDSERLHTTTPNNVVLRPDVETAQHSPELQTQQGPLQPEAPPSYANKSLAITTTVLHPDPTFTIWLDYHLRRAAVILIFMDDPAERPMFERLIEGRTAVLFDGSDAGHEWSPESRVMVRQNENNEKALDFALSNNITWLLHIDPDELFYEDGDRSWETDTNIGQIRFTNHEAVFLPYEVVNFFANCTIFWSDNLREHMRAYYNGKSAVRLTPDVSSNGPHSFLGFQGEDRYVQRPMILHYPTPTFDRWVAKFTHYGNFSGNWYNNPETPMGFPFMTGSRDHVQAALRSGNWTAAREYYISQTPDPSTVEDSVRTGDLLRIKPFDDIEL